jgi:photosystem II stability/assembly factor-like uncharacterized protein
MHQEFSMSDNLTHLPDYVFGLAASPAFARDTICFAARRSGLYRSIDNGKTWQTAYGGLSTPAPETTAVILSPSYEKDRTLFAAVKGGVLLSTDAGETWQSAEFSPPPPVISAFAISPAFAKDGLLLAGTLEDGIFRSRSRGAQWSGWNFGLLDRNIYCLAISPDFIEDQLILTGTESGIFQSFNEGRSWREVSFPMEAAPVTSLAISPGFTHDHLIIAGTESRGIFCSRDAGANWEKTYMDGSISQVAFITSQNSQTAILAACEAALLVSVDNGKSWQEQPSGIPEEREITSFIAPLGIDSQAPILTGFADGEILVSSQ